MKSPKKGDVILVRDTILRQTDWNQRMFIAFNEDKVITLDHTEIRNGKKMLVQWDEWKELPKKLVKAWAVIDRDSDNKIIYLCKYKEEAEALGHCVHLHTEFKGYSIIQLVEDEPIQTGSVNAP